MLDCRVFSEIEVFCFRQCRWLVGLDVFESFLEVLLTSSPSLLSRRVGWPRTRHLDDCSGGNVPRVKQRMGDYGVEVFCLDEYP